MSIEITKPLPCFRCGRQLDSAMDGDYARIPYGGTIFKSAGHYGSTVFDEADRSWLEIVICDECILSAARAQGETTIVHGHPHRVSQPPPEYTEFDTSDIERP